MPVVLEHVTHDYPCGGAICNRALDDVSLEIADGEFVGIIGHTGSGKSTLVQHINGLLQPTSGRVVVNGIDLADKRRRKEVRRQVGMAFQYPESQLFAETVAEDIAFGPRNLGLAEDEVQRRVRTALLGVEMDYDRYAYRSPFDLSGGEMRRIALAGIIAMDPKIFVLDEPMAGLDPAGRKEIMRFIHGFHEHGMTIIMVSHSMEDVAANAERIVVLRDGRIFADGQPQEVFSRPAELREIGLGVPFASSFATRLRDRGLPLAEGIFTLDALADSLAATLSATGGELA